MQIVHEAFDAETGRSRCRFGPPKAQQAKFACNNANNMTFVKQRRESQSYGIASKACLRYKA
jgi:hypothetical protein